MCANREAKKDVLRSQQLNVRSSTVYHADMAVAVVALLLSRQQPACPQTARPQWERAWGSSCRGAEKDV